MSHYTVAVFSNIPEDKAFDELLAPYDENIPNNPNAKYDYYSLGGKDYIFDPKPNQRMARGCFFYRKIKSITPLHRNALVLKKQFAHGSSLQRGKNPKREKQNHFSFSLKNITLKNTAQKNSLFPICASVSPMLL